jgi:hypothetical protein
MFCVGLVLPQALLACVTPTTTTNPMTLEFLGDPPGDTVPACPLCGEPLYPFGAIVEKWGLLHWVEAWHCPTHGQINQDRLEAVDSNAPKPN